MANDLHTKYRPRTFDDVLGQDGVVKSLGKVLDGQTARAFVFTGPSGTGKTTLARIIASQVGCLDGNLVEIDAATHTGIDAMRDITESLIYSPLGKSKARMVIVDEAHALSKAAWQSLLKVIEEPPPHVWWALCTTEGLRIPDTIRTRCVTYELKPVGTELILELLQRVVKQEGLDVDEDVVYLVAEKSEGSPRRALTGLSKCVGCSNRKEAAALLRAASEDGEAVDLCRALAKGTNWTQAMTLLKPLKDQAPESIRIIIVNYFAAIALGAKSDDQAQRACAILDAFRDPYPQGANYAHLVLSLGQVLLG